MSECIENVIYGSNDYFPSFFSNFIFPDNGIFHFFGFSLSSEDLLIVALAFYLFTQDNCDYLLIGVLVLILFN